MRLRFAKYPTMFIVIILTAEFIISGIGICGHHHHHEHLDDSLIHHEIHEPEETHNHTEEHSDTCDHQQNQCHCVCLGHFVAIHEIIQISFSLNYSESLSIIQPIYQSEWIDHLFRPPIYIT